jgi:hypothetical protein
MPSKEIAMTRIIDTKSKRHLPAKLAAGLAISAFLVLGTFVASASAENWAAQNNAEKNRGHRDEHRHGRGNDGRYYSAPPLVYGSPYDGSYYGSPYNPPPVVYGPGIGIGLPGVNINIW